MLSHVTYSGSPWSLCTQGGNYSSGDSLGNPVFRFCVGANTERMTMPKKKIQSLPNRAVIVTHFGHCACSVKSSFNSLAAWLSCQCLCVGAAWVLPAMWVTHRAVDTSTHYGGGGDAHEWYLCRRCLRLEHEMMQQTSPRVHIWTWFVRDHRCWLKMEACRHDSSRCVMNTAKLHFTHWTCEFFSLPGIDRRETKKCHRIRHFENTFVVETVICDRVWI